VICRFTVRAVVSTVLPSMTSIVLTVVSRSDVNWSQKQLLDDPLDDDPLDDDPLDDDLLADEELPDELDTERLDEDRDNELSAELPDKLENDGL